MVRWFVLAAAASAVILAGRAPSHFSGWPTRVVCWGADGQKPAEKPLKLPDGWNPNDPLPVEKTNCVRCHLTAGRELTAPVRDFARSVHDLSQLSCHSCHGGNLKEDATAHENKFGFIGTKLSAHMAACSQCHNREAQQFTKSKHYRDLAKKIDRGFPTCVDCHGNHDVGRPPPEFTLTNVCADCHKQFARDFPQAASVVAENDRLWQVLRQLQTKNKKLPDPVPEQFRKEVNACRAATARLMHHAAPVTAREAEELNARVQSLRERVQTWLKEQK